MIRGGQVLTEIGIDRWRLRRVGPAPAVQSEVESPSPEPITGQLSKEIVQSETELDWQIVIRNYRTLATLQLVRQAQDPPIALALNQLSDDLGLAVNGLATKPLVQSQLFSTCNEQVIDSDKVLAWVADLPATLLLLSGQCPELITLIEQASVARAPRGFSVIQVPDLLDPVMAVERKARLWQQLSARKS
ncbi:MAG: hypothetical protein ACJASJ_000503 [Candidatus Azotimanducaceae bacterium]